MTQVSKVTSAWQKPGLLCLDYAQSSTLLLEYVELLAALLEYLIFSLHITQIQ